MANEPQDPATGDQPDDHCGVKHPDRPGVHCGLILDSDDYHLNGSTYHVSGDLEWPGRGRGK
jgi:hypothetical protein